MGPGGAAAVSFVRYEPSTASAPVSRSAIWASVHEQGAAPTASPSRAFSEPEQVTAAGQYPIQSTVGIDAAGNMTLVYWVGGYYLDPEAKIYARYRPSGGPWGEPQFISSQAENPYDPPVTPALTVAPNGRAILLTEAGLFDRAPGASAFSAAPGTADVIKVAMNPAGNVAAVSAVPVTPVVNTPVQDLIVRTRTTGRPFGAARTLGQIWTVVVAYQASVAMTDNGTVVLPWSDAERAKGIHVAVRTPGSTFATGTWAAPVTLEPSTNPPAGSEHPILGAEIDAGKTVVVSWNYGSKIGYKTPFYQQSILGPGPSRLLAAGPGIRAFGAASTGGRAISVREVYSQATGSRIRAQVRPTAGAAFGSAQTVVDSGSDTQYVTFPAVGLDGQGNGFIAWFKTGAGTDTIEVTGYDPIAPRISAVSAQPGAAGTATTLSGTATDRMSTPKLTWSFGDGTPGATGGTVSHTYAQAGTYTAKLTATDDAGNRASWPKTVTVP